MDLGPSKKRIIKVEFFKHPKTNIGINFDQTGYILSTNSDFANRLFPGDCILSINGHDGRSYTFSQLKKKISWLYFTFGFKEIVVMRKVYPKYEDPISFMLQRYIHTLK